MNKSVSVFESLITINGEHIHVALGKSSEKIANGTVLSSSDGKQWKVINNDSKWSPTITKLIKEKEAEGIFFYELNGIGHMKRPNPGEELTII